MDYASSFYQVYLKENKSDKLVGLDFQSPYFVFEYEILIKYIRILLFYLVRLRKMGIRNRQIEDFFLKIFFSGLLNIEYTEKQFFEFITILYDFVIQAQKLYISVCEKNNLNIETAKTKLKDPRTLSFLDLIKEGQKEFNRKFQKFDINQIKFFELYMNIVKSIAIHFTELKILGVFDEASFNYMTDFYSMPSNFQKAYLQKSINAFAEIDHQLLLKIYEVKKEKYGEIESAEISTSIIPGKAILVSGSNLAELEMILEASKYRNINIYTYGNMISAHTYPKFKTYPHLVGHFSKDTESYLADFSEFPGAILLTSFSFINVEKFYQGRIYTTDTIAPQNVIIIKDYDFEPLIQSALHSDGFIQRIEKDSIKFNISEAKFFNEVNNLAQEIEEGRIKHIFAMGIPQNTIQKEYFDKFLNLLEDDCFIFSFSYFNRTDLFFHLESDYIMPFLYKALDILLQNNSIEQLNPIILFTRCEIHIFSNLFYLKQIGVKQMYLADYPPNLINPAFINFIRETFDVKNYTNPKTDLKDMLADKE